MPGVFCSAGVHASAFLPRAQYRNGGIELQLAILRSGAAPLIKLGGLGVLAVELTGFFSSARRL
jgi:hypothetical protein